MSKEQCQFIRDLWHDLMLLIGKKPKQISLLARSIQFSTNAGWINRLTAYQQLIDWVSVKHTNKP